MENITHSDGITWNAHARVLKYSASQVNYAQRFEAYPTGDFLLGLFDAPEDGIVEQSSNLLTTLGLNRITSLIIGGGGAAFSNANALTGVGNSTTAATTADTHLTANSTGNSRYIVMDASFPTQSNGLMSGQSTFGSSDGNFAWQEWGWVIAASPASSDTFAGTGTSPVMLNHKVASFGTKGSGAIWVFQTSVTLT